MPYIYIYAFVNNIGEHSYKAYSSTDSERSHSKLYEDICWSIGYQPTYPSCKHTYHGQLVEVSSVNWSVPVQERGDAIRCVIRNNHLLNTTYAIKRHQESYSTNIPAAEGTVKTIEHSIIEPNVYYPESDSDSSDSD
jgi:hypothetical protein